MNEVFFDFANVGIFLFVCLILVFGTLLVASLIRPKKITKEKLTTYECGEIPVGSPWIRYNIRFYNIALVFLIFDVEMVFLYPVAVALWDFKKVSRVLGALALVEILIFVIILAVGLAYAWRWGNLDWIRGGEVKKHHQSSKTSE